MGEYTVILICILVMAYILNRLENRRVSDKGKKALLRESFGSIPKPENRDYGGIEYDWDFERAKLPPCQQVDDVTWNDLEMDAVYLRINNCQSFAGEQALYAALHRLRRSGKEEAVLNETINFFGEQEQERQRAMYLLHCLGKQRNNYYLPVFIHNLSGFAIPNIQFYRFMRGLLICSVLPCALLLDTRYLALPLFAALANLVIYSFQKYKYGINLAMLRSTLGIIRTAKLLSDPKNPATRITFTTLATWRTVFPAPPAGSCGSIPGSRAACPAISSAWQTPTWWGSRSAISSNTIS